MVEVIFTWREFSMSEITQKNLERIKKVVNSRRHTFNKVSLGLAFYKIHPEDFQIGFGRFLFLSKSDTVPDDAVYEYDDLKIIKKSINIDEALRLLEDALMNESFVLDDKYSFQMKVNFHDYRSLESKDEYGYYRGVWSYVYAYGGVSLQSFASEPLVKLGLPLFPSWNEAVAELLDVHTVYERRDLVPRFEVIVPDYRARIKHLRLTGKRVQADIETLEISEEHLKTKFYCRTDDNHYTSEDLPIEDGRVVFTPEEIPHQVEVHIVSAQDGESIDRKSFDIRYPTRGSSVITRDIETQLIDLIDRGESKTLEFKEKLNRERPKEFLETVVAFSNTQGGTILLGVDDNCRIVGFKEDVEETILNWIAEYCDPPIDVKIKQGSRIQEKEIVLIEVVAGKNKPYNLKDGGIYVRRGPSDRQIKRTELDELYENRSIHF